MNNSKKSQNQKILSVVYDSIDYDGRAQRTVEALSEHYCVTIFSIDSGHNFSSSKFSSKVIALPNLKRFKILRHLYFWLRFWINAFKIKPNIVWAHNYFVVFPSWIAARLNKSKLIYDAYELIIPERTKPQSYRDKFWYLLEQWTIKKTDLVIVANQERAELMKEHYRLLQAPLVVRNIPPIPSSQFNKNEILMRYPVLHRKHKKEILLVYCGNIDLDRGIENFVEAIKYLDERFRLILVGGGPDIDFLEAVVTKLGLQDRVLFTNRVPHLEIHSILQMCDVGLITYSKNSLNDIYCAPNKIYEYAQAGLPIITTDQPPLRNIIDKYNIGAYISFSKDSDSKARLIAKQIELFVLNQDTVKLKSLIYKFINENSWDREKKKLIEAVLKI